MEMAMTGSLDIKQLRLPNQPLASSTPPPSVNLTAMTMTVELRRQPQVQRICFRSWRIPSQFPSQENLNYLWKLGAGSIVGAAAIKYGSVLFPEITRPNLLEAIIIISSPVIVAVLLLIRQSRLQQ